MRLLMTDELIYKNRNRETKNNISMENVGTPITLYEFDRINA